jgi:hypothetical protein
MNKDWRTILRFAIVGLSIATVFFTLFESKSLVDNSTPVWTHGAALILWFYPIRMVDGGW